LTISIGRPGARIKDTGYFYVLDGLRGIAAIGVVIRHTPRFFPSFSLPDSFLAVDIFLVLSGFVLAANYEKRFDAGMSVREFTVARLIRLYPLYVIGLFLGVLTALLSVQHPSLEIKWSYPSIIFSLIPNLFMLPSPYPNNLHYLYPFNPVMWSIFFELLTNVLYVSFYRLSKNPRLMGMFLTAAAIFLVVMGAAHQSLNSGFDWYSFHVGLARVLYSFPIGVLLYRMSRGRRNVLFFPPVLLFLLIIGIFALSMRLSAQLCCVLIVFPAIVYVASLTPVSAIGRRIYAFLGMTSFGIYALHKGLYQLILGAMIKFGAPNTKIYFSYIGPLFIVFVLLVSVLVEIRVDSPARLYLRKRFTHQRTL
jgi:peptidoglycan/LPS O-acetylase OafA/YrhL